MLTTIDEQRQLVDGPSVSPEPMLQPPQTEPLLPGAATTTLANQMVHLDEELGMELENESDANLDAGFSRRRLTSQRMSKNPINKSRLFLGE